MHNSPRTTRGTNENKISLRKQFQYKSKGTYEKTILTEMHTSKRDQNDYTIAEPHNVDTHVKVYTRV